MHQSRRQFLAAGLAALPLLAGFPRRLLALAATRSLSFYNTHTGERLVVEYFAAGDYLPDALREVNWFLRDFRTGGVHDIDPGVLDILTKVHQLTGARRPFDVISGYRSPETNAMLRQHSREVASGSLHMVGKAIDVRLPGVALTKVRDAGLALGRGGVGYYRRSDFVHLDTGRVRRW
ncbi:MAG TPA: DUF882 domain-containing protein [Gemmatimonadales bacterium]|nr:DUF882 domain-containing protein [Gemmatimonadales bacterium]